MAAIEAVVHALRAVFGAEEITVSVIVDTTNARFNSLNCLWSKFQALQGVGW